MGEIKFRFWDKEFKSFTEPYFYFVNTDGSLWFNLGASACSKDDLIDQSDKLEVMQYTGLKDRNGKEIYEGDIIDQKYKWRVVFEDGAFWGTSTLGGTLWKKALVISILKHRITAKCPCEILGNIYENPELLK